jgi:hypothetical protein
MNKIEKAMITVTVVGMVGFAFALSLLSGIPKEFDWEEDDDE